MSILTDRYRGEIERLRAENEHWKLIAAQLVLDGEAAEADLDRALDALAMFVVAAECAGWSGDSPELAEARAVLAAHDREAPGGRMSELRSEVLDHFRSTAGGTQA